MKHSLLGAALAVSLVAGSTSILAQQPEPPRKAPPAPVRAVTSTPANFTPKRTSDGQPDISGNWSNATYTPLERPADLKDKAFFTPEEAAAFAQRRLDGLYAQPKDALHYDDAIWQSEKTPKGLNSLRTSLVTDPADGRIPPVLPQAQQRIDAATAARRGIDTSASVQNRGLTERCITSVNLTWPHDGAPMLPEGYNSNLRITQGLGYVVIEQEMVHNARVIPLDGRPHVGEGLRQYIGDYRGRWEGTTLVIESTNFNEKTPFRGSTRALKVTERITPVDADTLMYRATVEDPNTWAQPWTLEYPIVRTVEPIYEYACHEGNYGVANILRAARKAEAAAAAPTQNGSK
jgi:hypothetical protein